MFVERRVLRDGNFATEDIERPATPPRARFIIHTRAAASLIPPSHKTPP